MTYFTAFMIPLDEEFKILRRKENILDGLIPEIQSANKMSNIEVFLVIMMSYEQLAAQFRLSNLEIGCMNFICDNVF